MLPSPELSINGLATNGTIRQFGLLYRNAFTVDPYATSISNPDTLSQRLHAVFRAVQAEAVAHVRSPAA